MHSFLKPPHASTQDFYRRITARLIQSFLHLLEASEDGLRTSFPQARKRILESQDRKLNPAFFIAHQTLLDSLEAQDASAVEQTLRGLEDADLSAPETPVLETIRGSESSRRAESLFRADAAISFEMEPLAAAEFATEEARLREAHRHLSQLAPALFFETQTFLSAIWLCDSQDFRGVSSFKYFGGIFLSKPRRHHSSFVYYLEWLAHETGHLRLHLELTEDALIENPVTERHASPLRRDSRPLIQIVHAAGVLARSILVLEQARDHGLDPAAVQTRLPEIVRDFHASVQTLRKYARWTPTGAVLFEELEGLSRRLS